MSHTSETKTKVYRANEQLVGQAVSLLMKADPSLKLETHRLDWGMNKVPAEAALFSPTLERGLAITFRNGQPLSFSGDYYGVEDEVERLQKLLVNTYTTLIVQKASTLIHHEVVSTVSQGNKTLVEVRA